MDKNVGSVDLAELMKAREELNQERGIETDPDMYKNYNPNRNAESSSLQEGVVSDENSEETIIGTPVEPVETFDSRPVSFDEPVSEPSGESFEIDVGGSYDSAIESEESSSSSDYSEEISISHDETSSDYVDTYEEFESEIDSLVPHSEEEEKVEESGEPAERDFSVYDNFAAFDIENDRPSVSEVDDEDDNENVKNDEDDNQIISEDEVDFSIGKEITEADLTAFENDFSKMFEVDGESQSNDEFLSAEEDSKPEKFEGLENFEVNSDFIVSEENDSKDQESNFEAEETVKVEPAVEVQAEEPVLFDEPTTLQGFDVDVNVEAEPVAVDPMESDPEDVASETDDIVFENAISEEADSLVDANEYQEMPGDKIVSQTESVPEEPEDENSLEIVDNYKKLSELLREEELAAEKLQNEKLAEMQEPKEKYPEIEEFNFVDVIALEEFKKGDKLTYLLGKDELGNNVYGNLRDFYNMVVFGKTQNTTNNIVHSVLLSLILKNNIQDVNFVICDSKADSKFEIYNKSSYMYFNRIAKTNKEILDTLIEVIKELEERYKMLAAAGVKSIEQYNIIAKNDNLKELPYIVTVFNNYSKAIQLTEADKINTCLYQILKLGRIVGMYLIIVANTTIRSEEINYNLPTRIAFKVDEEFDSVSTLGYSGAEQLISSDEFLYSTIDSDKVTHLKAPTLSETEIELLVQNIED